ncbi:hypothetical protein PAMP_000551 [Pampus punctatissimus]
MRGKHLSTEKIQYICKELSLHRCEHERTHHVLRGLIPLQLSDRGDTLRKTADCCSGKREHVMVGVQCFLWEYRTTMFEGGLPVMAAGPANRKSLAHILEARPKSLLLLLLSTLRSPTFLLRLCADRTELCTEHAQRTQLWHLSRSPVDLSQTELTWGQFSRSLTAAPGALGM